MTARRAAALARLLAASTAYVIEDDHSGDISSSDPVSIGRHLPGRTVHIRSFSKSHGPDLRLAAVGGAGEVVATVANRRLLGPGWSSRILQALLLALLDDPATIERIADARAAYAERRRIVTDVLHDRGVPVSGADGINLWIEVADERTALITLAARGIGAAPGEPFLVHPDTDHLRVTVGAIVGPVDQVRATAVALAEAAGRVPTRSGSR